MPFRCLAQTSDDTTNKTTQISNSDIYRDDKSKMNRDSERIWRALSDDIGRPGRRSSYVANGQCEAALFIAALHRLQFTLIVSFIKRNYNYTAHAGKTIQIATELLPWRVDMMCLCTAHLVCTTNN